MKYMNSEHTKKYHRAKEHKEPETARKIQKYKSWDDNIPQSDLGTGFPPPPGWKNMVRGAKPFS